MSTFKPCATRPCGLKGNRKEAWNMSNFEAPETKPNVTRIDFICFLKPEIGPFWNCLSILMLSVVNKEVSVLFCHTYALKKETGKEHEICLTLKHLRHNIDWDFLKQNQLWPKRYLCFWTHLTWSSRITSKKNLENPSYCKALAVWI